MNVRDTIERARDAMTVKRVFGEAYERDGIAVIPVAKVWGGAGGGEGTDASGSEKGSGVGFGLIARPAGVYVIRDGEVRWRPAIDANRVIAGVLGILALLALGRALRRRSPDS